MNKMLILKISKTSTQQIKIYLTKLLNYLSTFFARFINTKAKYAPFHVVRIDDVHLGTSDVFSDNVLVQEHIVTDRNSLYKCTNRGARM